MGVSKLPAHVCEKPVAGYHLFDIAGHTSSRWQILSKAVADNLDSMTVCRSRYHTFVTYIFLTILFGVSL